MLSAGNPKQAWVGNLNGRRFTLMASMGFDATVVDGVNLRLKKMFGKGAYVFSACQQWATFTSNVLTVEVDGHRIEALGVIVTKARSYGGRFTIAPDLRITDPMLHVILISRSRRSDLLRYASALVRHSLHKQRHIRIIPAQHVTISGSSTSPIQVDGDILARGSASISVDPIPLMLMTGDGYPSV